jgi:hypothetical protein
MRQHRPVLAASIALLLPLAVGCAHTTRGERISQTPPPPPAVSQAPPVVTPAPPPVTPAPGTSAATTPIPGHPPVTVSGVVSSYDRATGIVTFQDGRRVKVTEQSTVLERTERSALRPGESVVVRRALPLGLESSGAAVGQRQRMATVASIDEPNQMIVLSDGTAVRVTNATRMHMGLHGPTVVLNTVRPGDEIIVVTAPPASSASGAAAPSALPRQALRPGESSAAPEASEIMVFRHQSP